MLNSASEFRVTIKRLYKLYLDKYESACMWREHEKAIRMNGNLNALEHVLIEAGEGDWVSQQRSKVEERRNKVLELWRNLKK